MKPQNSFVNTPFTNNIWELYHQNSMITDERDHKIFAVFALFFVGLSTIALQYQQYITSTVLYFIALFFEFVEVIIQQILIQFSLLSLVMRFRAK